MPLNGFVSAEDRASRLVMTRSGFVVVIRRKPQHYEVRRDGVTLGVVTKFKHWYAELDGDRSRMEPMGGGSKWPWTTRQAAIEWMLKNAPQQRAPDNAEVTGLSGGLPG